MGPRLKLPRPPRGGPLLEFLPANSFLFVPEEPPPPPSPLIVVSFNQPYNNTNGSAQDITSLLVIDTSVLGPGSMSIPTASLQGVKGGAVAWWNNPSDAGADLNFIVNYPNPDAPPYTPLAEGLFSTSFGGAGGPQSAQLQVYYSLKPYNQVINFNSVGSWEPVTAIIIGWFLVPQV
jgi:hypothetical protein